MFAVQPVGRGWQVALASAAPHACPGTYAQYSVAAQVSPAKPPHALAVGHAFFVQASIPSEQLQMLQPSLAGMLPEPSG